METQPESEREAVPAPGYGQPAVAWDLETPHITAMYRPTPTSLWFWHAPTEEELQDKLVADFTGTPLPEIARWLSSPDPGWLRQGLWC